MIERAHGIILRTRHFTETSLIVEWLTPESGRFSTVAKGARRQKSPFRGKLDLFYEAEFSFNRSRRSELHTLSEVSLRETHSALRHDLGYVRQASYCAALIEQTTEKETPLPAIHELMRSFLAALPEHPPQPRNIYAFELKLLEELGLQPDPDQTRLGAETRSLMEALLREDWRQISTLKAAGAQVTELRRFLHGFLIHHLGKLPKGREDVLAQPA
ncbi:MAG TPA: DNA repair protein RecO [Candidatus Paceibacterota bacterium]|nr:DNA repair protein RecO [Candidatus Paceibacterota bacterium]